jgi:hypothetical protein
LGMTGKMTQIGYIIQEWQEEAKLLHDDVNM